MWKRLLALTPLLLRAADQTASPLDRYIAEALTRTPSNQASPGSLYSSGGRLADLGRDLRASQVDDLITIVVSDQASALARGTSKSARTSSAKSSITALARPMPSFGALANLANLSGDQQLDGSGATTRNSSITTTLSARVTYVLPNGYLVVEGTKNIVVNSETQMVSVRGIVRLEDLTTNNQVRSDRLAQLEIRVNGNGIVGDAIRRPNLLYRILLGILPF